MEIRTEILQKIQDVVRDQLNDPELMIGEKTRAADVTGWDSLTHVQIIVGVEKKFGFRLKASEVAQLEDVGTLIDFVVARGKR
jgi:acyl carrier protein